MPVQKFYKPASEMEEELLRERLKDNVEKLEATIDYIAMMSDIDLEGNENE